MVKEGFVVKTSLERLGSPLVSGLTVVIAILVPRVDDCRERHSGGHFGSPYMALAAAAAAALPSRAHRPH